MRLNLSILTLALAASLSASAYQFSAQNEDGVTLYFDYNMGKAVVTCGSTTPSYSGDVKIPATVSYYGSEIAVSSIDSKSFQNCSSLTSVTIPESITTIDKNAFKNCTGLTTVNFNATKCETMGKSSAPVFEGCTSLATVNFGENVQAIPSNAFYGSASITSINIPEGVTSIGGNAFKGCKGLTTVTIPESITSVADQAFANCTGLTTVNFNATNCTTMGSTESESFKGCTALTTLNIGENVTNIPKNAFKDSSALTSVNIPNSVTTIGEFAFQNCTSIENLTIGEGVTSIGNLAFSGCTNLETVNFNATECATMSDKENLVFADEVVRPEVGVVIVKPNTSIKTINIGNNVKVIPDCAFQNCTALETLDLSKATSLETIGSSSFENCEALKAVDLSKTEVTTINDHAFSGCRGMKTLNLGKTEKVGAFAFDWCRTLEALVLPESLTEIGDWGFGNLLGLNTTTIYGNPSDITIGASAFYNNQSILLNYSDEEMYPHSIEGCGGLMDSMDVVVNLKKIDGLLEAGTVSDPIATVYIRQTSLEGGIDPTIEFLSSDPDKARVVEDTENMEGKSITKHEVKIQAVAKTTEPVTITMTIGDTNAEIKSTVNIPIDVQVYGEKEGGEESSTTGIDNLFVDENGNTVEVYTLQGVKVSNQDLTPGIYVRRVGDKATKVIVK